MLFLLVFELCCQNMIVIRFELAVVLINRDRRGGLFGNDLGDLVLVEGVQHTSDTAHKGNEQKNNKGQ